MAILADRGVGPRWTFKGTMVVKFQFNLVLLPVWLVATHRRDMPGEKRNKFYTCRFVGQTKGSSSDTVAFALLGLPMKRFSYTCRAYPKRLGSLKLAGARRPSHNRSWCPRRVRLARVHRSDLGQSTCRARVTLSSNASGCGLQSGTARFALLYLVFFATCVGCKSFERYQQKNE